LVWKGEVTFLVLSGLRLAAEKPSLNAFELNLQSCYGAWVLEV
jgi:hypothetical protein